MLGADFEFMDFGRMAILRPERCVAISVRHFRRGDNAIASWRDPEIRTAACPGCRAPDTLRMLLRCTPHCGVVKEVVDQSGRSLFVSNQNSPRLHSHNSAMLRRTHWKSERIAKLTAAIKPMEAAPPIAAPIAAPRL